MTNIKVEELMEECENIVDSWLSTVTDGRTTTDNMLFYSYLPLWKIYYIKILNNISEPIMTGIIVSIIYITGIYTHIHQMLMGVVSNLVLSAGTCFPHVIISNVTNSRFTYFITNWKVFFSYVFVSNVTNCRFTYSITNLKMFYIADFLKFVKLVVSILSSLQAHIYRHPTRLHKYYHCKCNHLLSVLNGSERFWNGKGLLMLLVGICLWKPRYHKRECL